MTENPMTEPVAKIGTAAQWDRRKTPITVKLSLDDIAALNDMMKDGGWPNRTTLVKSLIRNIISDDLDFRTKRDLAVAQELICREMVCRDRSGPG